MKNYQDLIGKSGVALSSLHPSGLVVIENEVYEAKSEIEFIAKGNEIAVIDIDIFKNMLIVKKVRCPEEIA
ncbi:MAG: hypothetical protein KDD63_11845 [Bacteroidetes bacterium]|nr:hypothetical protein [Bacteroidota bacterium]MCB0844888.1 hypothetical protein [Bacteroidota bacterium]MCB0852911.1 hypothetical protein [Bacteroidota bacterium]